MCTISGMTFSVLPYIYIKNYKDKDGMKGEECKASEV